MRKMFDRKPKNIFLSSCFQEEIEQRISEILAQHGIENDALKADLILETKLAADYFSDALKGISTGLLGVDRYRNMRSFPVVVDMVKKAANASSAALNYRAPYPDHYSADD